MVPHFLVQSDADGRRTGYWLRCDLMTMYVRLTADCNGRRPVARVVTKSNVEICMEFCAVLFAVCSNPASVTKAGIVDNTRWRYSSPQPISK